MLGGPLGGIVVATIGLAAAAAMNSATYAVMFVVLLLLRPRRMTEPAAKWAATDESRSLLSRALDGLKLTARDPLLRAALVMLVGTAGFLLPVIVLLVPILARQQGWVATQAGAVAGASGLGTAVVAIAVLSRGGIARPGLASCAGLLTSGVGIGSLAAGPPYAGTLLAGALVGLGTGLFSTQLGPLVLGKSPHTHLARVQAVVALAQSLPLLVTNFVLGALAEAVNAQIALGVCSVALVVVAAVALRSPELRSVRAAS